MTPLRTRVAMIFAVALTCVFLVQCGDDVTAPDHSTEVNENIEALTHLDQGEAFEERPVGDPVAATYEVNGRTYECTEQTYEVAAEYDEQIVLNPTSDVLWPGAILDGGTIDTGGYVPILAPRTPVTISVSLVNIAGDKSRTVEDPKLSTMRQAIGDLLAQEITGATEARVTFEIVDVYSESQLDLALGVTYRSGLNNVHNQFDFSRTDILSRTVVKFMQVYYTIDVDIPEHPSDCFLSSVSWENLKDQITRGISPMYVSTIAYGRMALFSMESTYSSTQVHNALNASIAAISTQVDLDVQHKNVLQQSTMKATIIGGSGAQAVQVVNGFEGLRDYMTQGGNYDQNTAAAPLAYKMRYLCDNETCRIVMAQDYVVRSCNELIPGHYGIKHNGWYVAWFYVDYDLDGEHKQWYSGKFTAGFTRSVDIPAKATNVFVTAREDTGVGYRTIFRYPASGGVYRPEVKCWRVYNTTLNPKYESITCDF
jgi:thiol-activated cytolysin